ncbi:MAG: hypothetical protein RBJ76_13220 [Stenomitos frigidus ULC029]
MALAQSPMSEIAQSYRQWLQWNDSYETRTEAIQALAKLMNRSESYVREVLDHN